MIDIDGNAFFDLTTMEGIFNVMDFLDKHALSMHSIRPLLALHQVYLLSCAQHWNIIEAHKRAAIALINAGLDNNFRSIKLIVDRAAGNELGEQIDGVPLKCTLGTGGQMIVEVQYER